MKKHFIITIYTLLGLIYLISVNIYTESIGLYSLFTGVYFLLLYIGIYKPISYTYFYLSIFLFLGIWLKLAVHLILNYAYVEPIGSFYLHHTSMDRILVVAIIGGLGVIVANLLYRWLSFENTVYKPEFIIFRKPYIFTFYSKYKSYILLGILFIVITLCYANIIYAIQLSGIVPKTILIYPLNAIISWVIGVGFSILLIILIGLEIKITNKIEMKVLVFFAIIAAVTSIGILSRGQYIFAIGSLLIYLLFNYKYISNFNYYKLISYIIFVVFLFLVVISIVTTLREYYFSVTSFSATSLSATSLSATLSKILHLMVDRWLGMEGLMSVESYEHKSMKLFLNALLHIPKIGDIDIYQYISNAHYKDMDNTKFAFATIPGAIAFLYYTGSYYMVFVGMMFLTMLMMLIEYLIYIWYRSALLASFIGIYLANTIAQFGLAPINFLKSMFFTLSFLAITKILKIKKEEL